MFTNSMVKLIALGLVAGITSPVSAAQCIPGPVPKSWATPTEPVPYTPNPQEANTITLIMFRHGEKRILPSGSTLENGNMSAVGQTRARRLPARLQQMFGCPDFLVAPNPNVKIPGSNNVFFYYERPAGTIEPTAATLAYPLWMPYGADDTPLLADDLLTAPEFAAPQQFAPRKVFIAWEHANIDIMTHYILARWNLSLLPPGKTVDANGKTYQCQNVPTRWSGCDYDSIWVLNVQGKNICYTHMHENLNNPSYQKRCRLAGQ